MAAPPTTLPLSGTQIRDMFAAGMTWLERHVDGVNAVNVFPVPDGDTGTNMFLTMRSTLQEASQAGDQSADAILAAMAHGSLMGARGNSGVILSQIIRGFARAHEGRDDLDGSSLTSGLEAASDAAYKAVTRPAEGTILTVIRECAAVVRSHLDAGDVDVQSLLSAAVQEAAASVERTPTLLPALAEAEVVDAGGLGLFFLLEGMLRHLRGESLDVDVGAETDTVGSDWLAATERRHSLEESLYGYCTEVLIAGTALDPDVTREAMLELGDSVLVVGDASLVRVHVHTDDPGAVLTHGTATGSLAQVKVDNIRRQAERFVVMHEAKSGPPPARMSQASVAVVAGAGMAAVFESVGCTRVVSGGPTMNPSIKEILAAVEACPSDEVIVLPNDKNIMMAAQQAAGATTKRVHVVPSRSMPQGLAALLAMNPEESVEENVAAMEEALGSVKTIEVTRAVRSTSVGGVVVSEGQVIAVVDDRLELATDSPEAAVVDAVRAVAGGGTSLITLYRGGASSESDASALADLLREQFPDHEVEAHNGGQPHYDYIVSVE
jgi:DAK2 domain fusion protein YloV